MEWVTTTTWNRVEVRKIWGAQGFRGVKLYRYPQTSRILRSSSTSMQNRTQWFVLEIWLARLKVENDSLRKSNDLWNRCERLGKIKWSFQVGRIFGITKCIMHSVTLNLPIAERISTTDWKQIDLTEILPTVSPKSINVESIPGTTRWRCISHKKTATTGKHFNIEPSSFCFIPNEDIT